MKKEITFYVLRMLLALTIMISLGVAGEWDYQAHSQDHPPEISY